ncbi:MAG: SDR family oxidoreductase [Rhodospirillales bacterium]
MSRKVFITGGASGIGLAMADAFLAAGAKVTLADRAAEQVEAARTQLQSGLGESETRVWAMTADVVEAAALSQALSSAARAMEGLDVVIANAGIGVTKPFLDTTPEEFEAVHAVNIRGVFHTLRAGAREMIARGRPGVLLVNASVTALRASANRAAYGSSKAAAVNLAQIAAIELAPKGIRVNAICPGPVDTPLTQAMHDEATRQEWLGRVPQHRYGTPAEIASLAVFLASPAASYITGQAVAVDGGWTTAGLFPTS